MANHVLTTFARRCDAFLSVLRFAIAKSGFLRHSFDLRESILVREHALASCVIQTQDQEETILTREHMATARNIRLGSHTQTHTRSIPRSIGYGSKGGCVIQALGSHNHHHHYYNHLCCHHSFCYCHCTCHLLLLLQQLYCCCYCYSLLSPVLPQPQI